MHPRVFLDSFWRNDIRDEVFVAMRFSEEDRERWEQIFKPAIEGEQFGELRLKAVRTDIRDSGDSILSEISDGICHSQLVLADISATTIDRPNGNPLFIRNGNVMYEVGLALACRQPVEVILIRDDDQRLLFDVSHVPVVRFEPSDVAGSVALVRSSIEDRLRERQLIADLRVQKILESLSHQETQLLERFAGRASLRWDGMGANLPEQMALPLLLEKRVVRLVEVDVRKFEWTYAWTDLGRVVVEQLRSRLISIDSSPEGRS